MHPSSWLDRYRAGHEAEVWRDLAELGTGPHGAEVAEQAALVCDEMAHRARWNIEQIVGRLEAQAYRFHTNDDREDPMVPFVPPGDQAGAVTEWLTTTFGAAVPRTLLSWLRIVGDVWLVGTHPEWPGSSGGDPLVIQLEGSHYPDTPIVDHFADELDAFQEEGGRFELAVAPDRLHKENVSGGGPYGFVLPDHAIDATFVHEQTEPFVAYLNRTFRDGGFPGPGGTPEAIRIREVLAEGLLRL